MANTADTIVRNFTDEELNTLFDEDRKRVTLSGHCFSLRKMKRMVFVVLRKHNLTIQCILMKKTNPEAFQILTDLTEESTVTITGDITKPPKPVDSCDVHQFEVFVHDVDVIIRATELPFFVADANEILVGDEGDGLVEDVEGDEEDVGRVKVHRLTRLESRWLDLRAQNNYLIVQLRSALVNSVRRVALDEEGFIEVSTPKIIPAVSESGAHVFGLKYFDRTAYLAQSPQLYKQMLINSGLRGVFEVGPVFRAENSCTYRHLCEFTGLDFEFPIEPTENHYDIVTRIWSILFRGFTHFYDQNTEAIEQILDKTDVPKPVVPEEALIIDFCTGVDMLVEAGFEQSKLEDIGSVNERELGKLVKEKYGSDLFVLINYPSDSRPFYTMVDYRANVITGERTYSDYSRSYDIIFRGSEISSGAQRNHDPEVLKERIALSGIELDFVNKTTGLEDYVRSFEHGSMPHGGCGIGVERLVMLYLGLPNVRSVSLFPRDPRTITP
jgi:aspartyl-tRNA synthetase